MNRILTITIVSLVCSCTVDSSNAWASTTEATTASITALITASTTETTTETSANLLPGAIASAARGDTLVVRGGVYAGPQLTIDRPLVLIGRDSPVLDGRGENGLLLITADSVSIEGFVFRNTGKTFMDDRSAVRFEGSHDCAVRDSRFEETFFGLYLAGVDRCEVRNNVLSTTPDREANGGNAIHSWYSKNLRIANNTITGHRDGIYLEFTEDSIVSDNTSSDNLRYGLHFMFSDRCSYRMNTFSRNGAGVAVMYADDITMSGNTFAESWGAASYGLLLKEIKGGVIENNQFRSNSVALFVESSDRLTFSGNRFLDNGWAVKVMADASGNTFSGNSFIRNTFDVATNSRTTSGSHFEGNFWDRYDGYDLDRDGAGDVPFHPVRLYSVVVEQQEPALVLLRSAFVDLLDAVESVLPVLTPDILVDLTPAMQPPKS